MRRFWGKKYPRALDKWHWGKQNNSTPMKAVNIEDALHKRPFKPFQLHMDNGDKIPVKHPECLAFSESKSTAVVVEGEHFHIVDLAHISSLAFARLASKTR
jgi:hypothetical protein